MSTMPIGVLSSEFSINDQVDNVNEIKNILESTEKTVSAVLNSSDFTDLSTALDCISRQFMNSVRINFVLTKPLFHFKLILLGTIEKEIDI